MKIQDISKLYGRLPQTGAFLKLEEDSSIRTVFLQGLVSSAVPLFFSALAGKVAAGTASTSSISLPTVLFVLNDADEAGYFYHDLTQIMGDSDVLFFPSAYRRAVKYGQRESSNEILRTEVLARVAEIRDGGGKKGKDESSGMSPLFIVTCPDALAELVVGRSHLNDHRISLKTGQTVDIMDLGRRMRGLGFTQVDYVYEPGQFAIRGSIVDVYSFPASFLIVLISSVMRSTRFVPLPLKISCRKSVAWRLRSCLSWRRWSRYGYLSCIISLMTRCS